MFVTDFFAQPGSFSPSLPPLQTLGEGKWKEAGEEKEKNNNRQQYHSGSREGKAKS